MSSAAAHRNGALQCRGAKCFGPGWIAIAGDPGKPQQFARVIGRDLDTDRTIRAAAIVEYEPRRGETGTSDRTDLQAAQVETIVAGRGIEQDARRGNAVEQHLAGLECDTDIGRVGMRKDDLQQAAKACGTGLHTARHIAVNIEVPGFEPDVEGATPARRIADAATTLLTIQLVLGLAQPQPLLGDIDVGLQLEMPAGAGPQAGDGLAGGRPDPARQLPGIARFDGQRSRQFRAIVARKKNPLEQGARMAWK